MPTKRTLVLVLGGVAGAVDAVGYVTLFHLFTANMTGNTVKAAHGLAAGQWSKLAWHAFPVAMFALGAIVGAIVARVMRSRARALALEAAALGAFAVLASSRDFGELRWLAAAMPATAMGIQSVTVRRCGGATVQTAFVSGVLVSFADALVSWVKSKRADAGARARLVLGIWCAYVLGAVAGFSAHARIGAAAIVLPLGGLFAAIVLVRGAPRARGKSALPRVSRSV